MSADTIIRAQVLHTPRDPFDEPRALEAFSDGALAVREGRIAAVGDWERVRAEHPDADVEDHRDALLLPGLVDLHVHYPQVAVIGAMGLELLEWLQSRTLPEEARLADTAYAREVAHGFVRALAANGTTTALVFGSHFPDAQDALFAEAEQAGLRIASGLVVSDRNLLPALHRSPEAAYEASRALIDRWHGRGRLRYAVTPRFSLSCTDTMLEACGALLGERPGLLFTSHINENPAEIRAVADLFPWARDYLDTYERYGLVGPGRRGRRPLPRRGRRLPPDPPAGRQHPRARAAPEPVGRGHPRRPVHARARGLRGRGADRGRAGGEPRRAGDGG